MRNKLRAVDNLNEDSDTLKLLSGKIRDYENYVKPQIDAADGKDFSITINKKTYTKHKDANEALGKSIKSAIIKASTSKSPIIVAEYKNLQLLAENKVFGKWDDNITFYFAVPNYRSTFKNLLGHNFEYMTDFVQVMNNNIKNLPNDIEGYRQRVIQLESNIKNYEELKNKTFDKEGEWLELQKKIKAIEKELGMGESIEAQPEIQDTDDNDDIDDELSDEDQSNTKKTRSKSSSGTQSRIATAPSSLGISKTGTAERKPISRTDLVDFIAEYLDIPIKKGKFRERALGIFKTHPRRL